MINCALMCVAPGYAPAKLDDVRQFNYSTQIGVAVINDDGACLDIRNADLAPGVRVQLVLLDKPQSVAEAEVTKKLIKSCSTTDINDETESHYALKILQRNLDSSSPAIAIINPASSFKIRNGYVALDLDADGRMEYFRSCASSEGLHLTVWSGGLLRGKRKWHRYYYLGYDTEPDCKAKETQ